MRIGRNRYDTHIWNFHRKITISAAGKISYKFSELGAKLTVLRLFVLTYEPFMKYSKPVVTHKSASFDYESCGSLSLRLID